MNKVTLTKLAVCAGILLVAAGYFSSRKAADENALSSNAYVLQELRGHVNDISALRFIGGGNTTVVSLKKIGNAWVALNADNYPADVSKLRNYLVAMSESKIREAKTSVESSYGKLGVEDIATSGAKGLVLELDGLKSPVKLIIGSVAGRGGDGAYVRKVGEKQSFLAGGQIRPEATVSAWVQADIVHVPSSRVQQVQFTGPGTESLRVRKTLAADADWSVQDVPKGKEVSSASVGNELAGVLDSLRLEAVSKTAPGQEDAASLRKAIISTFDGLMVEITSYEKDGKGYALFGARVDADLAATAAEQAAQLQAENKTGATFDPAKFKAEQIAKITAEAAEINARTAGWTYQLAMYKFASFKRSMKDMLKHEGPPAAGTLENPIDMSGAQ
jgi:hypothetical protein